MIQQKCQYVKFSELFWYNLFSQGTKKAVYYEPHKSVLDLKCLLHKL